MQAILALFFAVLALFAGCDSAQICSTNEIPPIASTAQPTEACLSSIGDDVFPVPRPSSVTLGAVDNVACGQSATVDLNFFGTATGTVHYSDFDKKDGWVKDRCHDFGVVPTFVGTMDGDPTTHVTVVFGPPGS